MTCTADNLRGSLLIMSAPATPAMGIALFLCMDYQMVPESTDCLLKLLMSDGKTFLSLQVTNDTFQSLLQGQRGYAEYVSAPPEGVRRGAEIRTAPIYLERL